MTNLLIPEDDLKKKDSVIRQFVEQYHREHQERANDDLYGSAFRYYLLFSDPAAHEKVGLSRLSNVAVFYNCYYWFLLFSNLYQAKHGPDAGLEQQSFRLLEASSPSLDWRIVEEISNSARSEALRLSNQLLTNKKYQP
jgi:hypothetical protein